MATASPPRDAGINLPQPDGCGWYKRDQTPCGNRPRSGQVTCSSHRDHEHEARVRMAQLLDHRVYDEQADEQWRARLDNLEPIVITPEPAPWPGEAPPPPDEPTRVFPPQPRPGSGQEHRGLVGLLILLILALFLGLVWPGWDTFEDWFDGGKAAQAQPKTVEKKTADPFSYYAYSNDVGVRHSGFIGPALGQNPTKAKTEYLRRAKRDPAYLAQGLYALGRYGKVGTTRAEHRATAASRMYRDEKLRRRDWPKLKRWWSHYATGTPHRLNGFYRSTFAHGTPPLLLFWSHSMTAQPAITWHLKSGAHAPRWMSGSFTLKTNCGGQVTYRPIGHSSSTPTHRGGSPTPGRSSPGGPSHHGGTPTHQPKTHHTCAIGESWNGFKCVKGNVNPFGPPTKPGNPAYVPPTYHTPHPTPGAPPRGTTETIVKTQQNEPPGGMNPTPYGTPTRDNGQGPAGTSSDGATGPPAQGVTDPQSTEGSGETNSGDPGAP